MVANIIEATLQLDAAEPIADAECFCICHVRPGQLDDPGLGGIANNQRPVALPSLSGMAFLKRQADQVEILYLDGSGRAWLPANQPRIGMGRGQELDIQGQTRFDFGWRVRPREGFAATGHARERDPSNLARHCLAAKIPGGCSGFVAEPGYGKGVTLLLDRQPIARQGRDVVCGWN